MKYLYLQIQATIYRYSCFLENFIRTFDDYPIIWVPVCSYHVYYHQHSWHHLGAFLMLINKFMELFQNIAYNPCLPSIMLKLQYKKGSNLLAGYLSRHPSMATGTWYHRSQPFPAGFSTSPNDQSVIASNPPIFEIWIIA